MSTGNFTVSMDFLASGGQQPGPFVFAPTFVPTPGTALTLSIPAVAGPKVVAGSTTCVLPIDATNTDFALTAWATNPQTSQLYATVSVAPTHVYSMADRGNLYDSFVAFVTGLTSMEGEGCLLPGAARVVGMRVAQALPLTFAETLQFAYGVRADLRTVDLHPGMSLRVANAGYGYVAPPTQTGGKRNAYGASGEVVLSVRRRADATLGFDASLDMLARIIVTDAGQQINGALDLDAQGAGGAYGRLVFPPAVDNVTAIASPPDPTRNVAIVFADTPADLATATANFIQDGDTGGVGSVVFFVGRAVVTPCVTIFLNGSAVEIPLGTTLADILARALVVTPTEVYGVLGAGGGGSVMPFYRWVQPSLYNAGFGPQPYNQTSFQFSQATTFSTSTGLTQWDLPLFAGDAVVLPLSGS